MENKFSFHLVPQARLDFYNIGKYIAEELQNPKAAYDFEDKFFEKVDVLTRFPLSGQLVDNKHNTDNDLRKIIVGSYIIFYKPMDKIKTIVIIRIIHGSRNIDKVLRKI